jgi:tetratricopeptide (TPR) repeat protein
MTIRFTAISFWLLIPAMIVGSAGCGKKTSREQQIADSVLVSAKVALRDGKYAEAKSNLRQAFILDERLGRGIRLAEESRLLARVAEATADFDSALYHLSRATQEYRNLAQRDSIRSIVLGTASLYRTMGQDRKAFAQLEEALRLARVFGDSIGVREIELALIPLCRSLENWEMESRIVNDLLKVYGAPPDPGKLARIYYEVARSQAFRREYDRAAEHFLRAFAFADQAHDSLLSLQSMVRVALAFDAAGRTTEAFQSFSDGLKRAGRTSGAGGLRSELLLRIGNAYMRVRMVDEARRFFNAALASAVQNSNKLLEGYCVIQLGWCDFGGGSEGGLKRVGSAISLFESLGYERGLAYAYDVLGAGLDRAGRFTESVQAYETAIKYFEGNRSPAAGNEIAADCEGTFHEQRISVPYDDAAEVLLRAGRVDEAFVIAERRQSWVLLSFLGGLELHPRDVALESALGEFQHAEAERIGAETRLAEVLASSAGNRELTGALRRVLEAAGKRLAEKAGQVARLHPSFEPFVRVRSQTINEVRERLQPGTVLVEYVPMRRTLYAFVLQSGRAGIQLAAVERERLMSAVRDLDGYCRGLEARGDTISRVAPVPDANVQELLRVLYEAFVRPVEGDLRGSTKAVLVLPVELAAVPVHALRRSAVPGTPYVGEQVAVSYLPAAAWLKSEQPVRPTVQEVVGVGFPGRTGWDVEYELRDIRAFFKEARLYFGSQASAATLEREQADMLHVALEIRYNPAAPGNAAAVLSDGKSAELSIRFPLGRFAGLTSYRAVVVSNLAPYRADAHVVVASSFLSGGASSVIISTHTPSRKAKKVFSEMFYTALLGGADVQTALRKVQSEMIRNPEFSSPLVWGPYMLWGQ